MPGKPRFVDLTRRVSAHYLMCGLAAIVWVGVGVSQVMNVAHLSRKEGVLTTQLKRAAAEASVSCSRHGETYLQSLTQQFRREQSLAYCAIVAERRYLAHSTPSFVGKPCDEPTGAKVALGDVERVRYVDARSRLMREYRIPITGSQGRSASLRFAVAEPEMASRLLVGSRHLPLAFMMPLAFLAIGVLLLGKTLRPLSAIDEQLRRAATLTSMIDFRPQLVHAGGPACLGWNRMIKSSTQQQATGTGEGLSEAVSQFREVQLKDSLDSLSEGLAITDDADRITFANQAMTALLDRRAEDSLCGANLEESLATRWNLPATNELRDPNSKPRIVTAEVTHVDSSIDRTLRLTRHPIRSRHGGESGYVWTVRDVSQQKLADKMRDQFVDTATHELRTPLANIKAYSETLTLAEITDVERQKQFLNLINTEATRLARFVDDLLSLSSIEVGSLAVNKKETDIRRMLDEVLAKAGPQMKQKQITFEQSLPEKIPALRVDKDKTAAALLNLLGNAAKYTPAGGRVAFRVRLTDDEILLDVEDTGYGIAQDELPNIFDKFFRSDDERVQAEVGTGLGLSLAREVIRLQGGELTVRSELNKGSVFSASLPIN